MFTTNSHVSQREKETWDGQWRSQGGDGGGRPPLRFFFFFFFLEGEKKGKGKRKREMFP